MGHNILVFVILRAQSPTKLYAFSDADWASCTCKMWVHSKHIERKYHLIREIVMKVVVVVEKITFAENLADPFMKTLSTRVFNGHKDNLGVRCVPNMLLG